MGPKDPKRPDPRETRELEALVSDLDKPPADAAAVETDVTIPKPSSTQSEVERPADAGNGDKKVTIPPI